MSRSALEDDESAVRSAALPTGVTLEYGLAGRPEAPVLAFVHGLGPNLRQFLPQMAHFAGRYRVLLVSLRGHGGSSAAPQPTAAAYEPEILARHVGALSAYLGIQRLHFVGNSLGGLLGYELLALGPPGLLSLTTFGTTAELHGSRMTYWALAAAVRLLGVKGMAAVVRRTATRDPEVGAKLAHMYRSVSRDALLLISRHIAHYDYTETLRRAEVPLLLIQGELDNEINAALDSSLEVLAEAPRSTAVCLAAAGHFANMERPSAFNYILGQFLDRV